MRTIACPVSSTRVFADCKCSKGPRFRPPGDGCCSCDPINGEVDAREGEVDAKDGDADGAGDGAGLRNWSMGLTALPWLSTAGMQQLANKECACASGYIYPITAL